VAGLYVLFDLDGTLVDSGPAHLRAAAAAFAERGIAADEAALRRFLVAYDARSADMAEDLYLDLWRRMQPLYRLEQPAIRPVAGIEQALAQLASRDIGAGVVTSKRRWAVAAELANLGWTERFPCVVCREDTSRHKPNPEPILQAQRALGGQAACYVGDAPSDVLAARAAGLPAIGVAWGWAGAAALAAAGAEAVAATPSELVPLLLGADLGAQRAADA